MKDQVLQLRQTQFSKTLTQMVFPITKNQSQTTPYAIQSPKNRRKQTKKKEAGTENKMERKVESSSNACARLAVRYRNEITREKKFWVVRNVKSTAEFSFYHRPTITTTRMVVLRRDRRVFGGCCLRCVLHRDIRRVRGFVLVASGFGLAVGRLMIITKHRRDGQEMLGA